MRVKRIGVKKLFGVFDHDIPLKAESGITIVIGENGLGKTVILEAVNAFFGKEFRFFENLEFEELYFYFTNDESWNVKKKLENGKKFLTLTRIEKDGKARNHKIYHFNDQEDRDRRTALEQFRRYNRAEIESRTIGLSHDERVAYHMMMDRRMLRLYEAQKSERAYATLPPSIEAAMRTVNVKIIETQRIITAKERDSDAYINTVEKYSNDLVARITAVAKKVSEVATELDSTYPNRLVTKLRQGTDDSFEELSAALSKLGERRKLLSSLGLVEISQDSELLQNSAQKKDLLNPLKLYIDDSHKKLAPYDDVAHKVGLFTAIVNKRFKHKKLEIQRDKGFVFRSTVKKDERGKYEIISAVKLSSGEQNELVIFYELIFNSKVGDMILIDEPELSLHISWQNKFIGDLKEVTSMNKVSIIIATHSPDIIDENWNLKVELTGVE